MIRSSAYALLIAVCTLLPMVAAAQGSVTGKEPALVSNGGMLSSFSEADNVKLTLDADFGRFVDPQITGRYRSLAISLLRYMPVNLRGDFIYIMPNGSILSNRMGLAFAARRIPAPIAQALRRNKYAKAMQSTRDSRVSKSRMLGEKPLAYPPTGGTGGAYIRTYSTQNINAAYGYVYPPCDVSLQSGESGNAYFNAYDSNGGDVVDAGIGTSIDAATTGNALSVAFVNIGNGNYYNYGWTNHSQTYSCGTPVGIMYGTLPSPNQNTSALLTGVPDYDPTQMILPPATATWTPASWTFFPTNSALLVNPDSWNGIASNCSGCSVGRMVTIAQPPNTANVVYDNSCYGNCNTSGYGDVYWYESVMGQLVAPCQNYTSTAECTIQYTSSWSGGVNDTGIGIAYYTSSDLYAAEGLYLNAGDANSAKSRRTFSSSLPAAPPVACPPDSTGHCSYKVSSVAAGVCQSGSTTVHGTPVTKQLYKYTYQIFSGQRPSQYLETATDTQSSSPPCNTTSNTWSPNNPAVTYNDSALP